MRRGTQRRGQAVGAVGLGGRRHRRAVRGAIARATRVRKLGRNPSLQSARGLMRADARGETLNSWHVRRTVVRAHQISNLTCFSGMVLVKKEAPMVDSCEQGQQRFQTVSRPAGQAETRLAEGEVGRPVVEAARRAVPSRGCPAPHLVLKVLAPHEPLHQAGLAAPHLPQEHQLALNQLLNHSGHGCAGMSVSDRSLARPLPALLVREAACGFPRSRVRSGGSPVSR